MAPVSLMSQSPQLGRHKHWLTSSLPPLPALVLPARTSFAADT